MKAVATAGAHPYRQEPDGLPVDAIRRAQERTRNHPARVRFWMISDRMTWWQRVMIFRG